MSSGGTDGNWGDISPPPPPPITDGRVVTTKRAKRLSSGWGDMRRRLVPLATTLLVSLILYWTARLDRATERAQEKAENVEAKAVTSANVAREVKVETAAFAGATKEKADSTGDDVKKLMDRLNVVEAELAALRAKAGRPRSKRKPLKPDPKTAAPLPTPAAAAAEAREEP